MKNPDNYYFKSVCLNNYGKSSKTFLQMTYADLTFKPNQTI